MEPFPNESARRPGRPRDVHAERTILEATIDLVAEVGFGGLTVDAVAARAAVGKATIYRRWASKAELVYAAMEATHEEWVPPDTGSLRADLVAVFDHLAEHVVETRGGRAIPALVAGAEINAELAELVHRFVAERRARTCLVFDRARARGEIGDEFDVELAIDMTCAPVFYRRLLSGAPLAPGDGERVVDMLLGGIAGTVTTRAARAV
ncbi:MAG: TetR-like C-terminal domain-containing protein [Acidimicrobiales bacterium]